MAYEKRGGKRVEQCKWRIAHAAGEGYGDWLCQDDDGHSTTPEGHEPPPNAVIDQKAKWVLP